MRRGVQLAYGNCFTNKCDSKYFLHLMLDSEFVLVYDLVRVGFDCMDTTYGQSLSMIG